MRYQIGRRSLDEVPAAFFSNAVFPSTHVSTCHLLLLDYDLASVNGLELIIRARELDHRCDTPIVVLAGSPVEAAAREARADLFLKKPQDIGLVVDTINRLLAERE